jgi:hypothetical protein
VHFNFLPFNAQNPLIEDGRGTFYLYRGSILAIDLSKKDLNRWFKGVIMIFEKLGCSGWSG